MWHRGASHSFMELMSGEQTCMRARVREFSPSWGLPNKLQTLYCTCVAYWCILDNWDFYNVFYDIYHLWTVGVTVDTLVLKEERCKESVYSIRQDKYSNSRRFIWMENIATTTWSWSTTRGEFRAAPTTLPTEDDRVAKFPYHYVQFQSESCIVRTK